MGATPSPAPTPWRAHITSWHAEQRVAGLSRGTIRTRAHYVRALARTHADPLTVTRADLVTWLAGPDWRPETLRSARAALQLFFAHLAATGARGDNPAGALPRVRIPAPYGRPAPDEVILQALAGADERTELMIRLAAEGGLRRAEVAMVRTDHLDGRTLEVTGKGSKTRHVPLPPDLARRIRTSPTGWLFPNPATGQPMTPGHVGRLVSGALPGRWTTHNLRHAAASAWAEAGLDLDEIAELLGHASIRTTAGYVKRRRPRLAAAVELAARRLGPAPPALRPVQDLAG